jgi:hypothetical protein
MANVRLLIRFTISDLTLTFGVFLLCPPSKVTQMTIFLLVSTDNMARDIMGDHIGIFRELDKNESIEFESKTIMPTVFMKEAEIKKVLGKERREFPISFTATNIYVTNKKLYFLILYQMGAKELTGEEKKSALSGIAGT